MKAPARFRTCHVRIGAGQRWWFADDRYYNGDWSCFLVVRTRTGQIRQLHRRVPVHKITDFRDLERGDA